MPPFWVGFSKQRKKPGWRRSSICVQNAFFQLFPSCPDKKNSREIKFYNFGLMPPFWVGFSKQRKKPGWRRSSNCVQNAFFSTFPTLARQKKQPLDQILNFRFHDTILGGLFQAAEKAGFTRVVQLRSKRVLLNFPIGGKRKNSLGIEFYNFGFMPPFWVGFSKQRKKPGWRRSSNCTQSAFFQLSPSGRSEKTALGSNFTISVSCHHFGWAFPSSGKSRVHKSGPIAFKTRFVKFPHRGETKKHPWDRILKFRFHATILGGLFQAAEKAGLTKVVQLRSKRVFFNFSHLGQTKKTAVGSNFKISVSWHHFGWAFPSSGKSRVHESFPIAFKTRFVKFPHRGETKKQPWDRILQFRFHATILGGLFQAAEKAGLTKVVQLRSKRVFFNFSHLGQTKKKQPWDQSLQFRFHATILGGFSKQRKKPGSRKWSNCVQNAFC